MKKIGVIMLACLLLLQGCNKVPENTVHSMDDLKGKKVGVQLKTTGDACATEMGDVDVQRFNRIPDAIDALRTGVLDAVIIDDETANSYVKKHGDIQVLGDACESESYGIVVKKGNEELLSDISGALKILQDNGTIDMIMDKWLKENETVSAYERTKSAPYANGKLVVATNAEFPPFESVVGNEMVGIDIDIIEAICDELDMDLELQNIAFDSVLSSVDRGMVDVAISAMSITSERKEYVDFSEPYATTTQVVLVRK